MLSRGIIKFVLIVSRTDVLITAAVVLFSTFLNQNDLRMDFRKALAMTN